MYPRLFAVRLSDDDYAQLEGIADERDCTLSDVIRDLIASTRARGRSEEDRGHREYREPAMAK